MRDVIVIGAGGGGPVVAKELAARGLDVLAARGRRRASPTPRTSGATSRTTPTTRSPATSASGPADRPSRRGRASYPAGRRSSGRSPASAGRRCTTTATARARCRECSPATTGPTRGAYDTRHRFPFTYRRAACPTTSGSRHTLPVQTAAMGTKEELFFRGARARRAAASDTTKDIHRARSGRRRTRSSSRRGTAGRTERPAELHVPAGARGCTFCGHCFQGCFAAAGGAAQPQGQALDRQLATCRWRSPPTPGSRAAGPSTLIADAFVDAVESTTTAARPEAAGVTWRDAAAASAHSEEAKVVVLAGGLRSRPRGCGSTAACRTPTAGSAGA